MKNTIESIQTKINELLARGHSNNDMVVSILTARLQNLKEEESWNKIYK